MSSMFCRNSVFKKSQVPARVRAVSGHKFQLTPVQVPPLRFLNIGGNSIGDDGASVISEGLVEAAGLRLLMLRFLGLDNNSMCEMRLLRPEPMPDIS
jgi:hypothetical protein